MKKTFTFLFLAIIIQQTTLSQVAINTTGNPPDGSAMLDISSNNKGMLVPRMTMVQRNGISNPATSLVIYQTDNIPGFYYNAGISSAPDWRKMGEVPSSAIVLSESNPNAALSNAGFSYFSDVHFSLQNTTLPANSWNSLNMLNGPQDENASFISIKAGNYIVMVKRTFVVIEVFRYNITT